MDYIYLRALLLKSFLAITTPTDIVKLKGISANRILYFKYNPYKIIIKKEIFNVENHGKFIKAQKNEVRVFFICYLK